MTWPIRRAARAIHTPKEAQVGDTHLQHKGVGRNEARKLGEGKKEGAVSSLEHPGAELVPFQLISVLGLLGPEIHRRDSFLFKSAQAPLEAKILFCVSRVD